jgi:hypothetical protein
VKSAAPATVPSNAARARITRIDVLSPFGRTVAPAVRIGYTES